MQRVGLVRPLVCGALCAGLALGLGAGPVADVAARPHRAKARPNIVIIMSDDQRWDTLRNMPTVRKRLAAKGVTFPNAFVPNSLCCPSRASTLTGSYSHTTGVYGNGSPFGGFASFRDGTTIATALHDSGYRTGFVGKYLNGYPQGDWAYVPPGWDRWTAIGNGNYYGYSLAVDGHRSRRYGYAPSDYSGRVLTRAALSFVRTSSPARPFFLFFAPVAPHASTDGDALPTPDPRDVDAFAGIRPWRPSTFGEPDASDKPAYISGIDWTSKATRYTDRFRQAQLEAQLGVDRSVGDLLAVLPPDTLLVYMSDNGFSWGEHRWRSKIVPYEESIRIPMIIRWTGNRSIVRGSVDDRLALNVDIAPTLAVAAGIDPATVPIGTDRAGSPVISAGLDLLGNRRRTSFVLEHWDARFPVPGYCGIRTADGWMFTRYQTGEEELYDLTGDSGEETNIVLSHPAEANALRVETKVLCDPVPPEFSWSTP